MSFLKDLQRIFRGNVGIMVVSWVLFGIGSAITEPYFSIYVKLLGGSDFAIGVISSASSLASLLLVIPGGYLTDVYGRRKVIVIGTWLVVLTYFAYALAPDWRVLLVVAAVDSLLHFYIPALMTIVADSLPEDARAKGLALTDIVTSLPWFILPPLGGYLLDTYGSVGVRCGYLAAGVLGICAAYLRTRFLEETLKKNEKGRETSFIGVLVSAYKDSLAALKRVPKPILVLLALSVLISSPSIVVFQLYGVVYAREVVGISMSEWGFYSSLAAFTSTVLGFALAHVLEKVQRRYFTFTGALILSTCYVLFLLFPVSWVVCLVLVLVHVARILYTSSWGAYVIDKVEPEFRGRIYAFSNVSSSIGYAWASLVLGYVYSVSAEIALMLSAVLAVVDALVLFTVMK